jgi:7-keto-8-aminopelargonate synthetase-like enzyme
MAYDAFEIQLRELTGKDRLRSLRERKGIDFTSNDYLGFAESEELRQAATVGPFLRDRGNSPELQQKASP